MSSRSTRFNTSFSASRSIASIALHGAPGDGRRTRGPLVTPIVQSTTFLQDQVGSCDGPTYSRVGNPTVDRLEEVLGALEDAPPAVCFGTGLAAETALFLATLKAGDHAVVGDAVYGGTTRLFRQVLSELGIHATFVASTDTAAVAGAITPRTKIVFVETPANPTLALTDIATVAAIARAAGAISIVDNTFLTPALQQPLELGADVSIYSTTKHIEGHSSALGGSIVSRDAALIDRIRWIRKCTGAIQAPLNSWLTLQGVKTLDLRMQAQSRSALHIARWLTTQPGVIRVSYPGLESSPQHHLALRQHKGGDGGVVAFEVAGGVEAGRTLMNSLQLCRLVEHVGSVETLITHPASMTHADVPRAQRERVGLTDGLIRLSVGLESPEEIIEDLAQAIALATSPTTTRATSTIAATVEGCAACSTR